MLTLNQCFLYGFGMGFALRVEYQFSGIDLLGVDNSGERWPQVLRAVSIVAGWMWDLWPQVRLVTVAGHRGDGLQVGLQIRSY